METLASKEQKIIDNVPDYAYFDAPHKFNAIIAIIGRRLKEHPNATCSYSGGSDSDIMLDLIERARAMFNLPPVNYTFFNTGLEMEATKRHIAEVAEKYGIIINTVRPKKGIVRAVRDNGVPIFSKYLSDTIGRMQKHNIQMDIVREFDEAVDKKQKIQELFARYPNAQGAITCLCSCNNDGEYFKTQTTLASVKYLKDFMLEYPIQFKVSKRCCDICKKQIAHEIEKQYEMVITGERKAEGGVRSTNLNKYHHQGTGCFEEKNNGMFRLKPLYYVSDADKDWYKEKYGIKYSDAYEVYGMKRTGCCGCPINYRVINDLEIIGQYEPNLVKAAWNVFGDSYRYRQKYNEYKKQRTEQEKKKCVMK